MIQQWRQRSEESGQCGRGHPGTDSLAVGFSAGCGVVVSNGRSAVPCNTVITRVSTCRTNRWLATLTAAMRAQRVRAILQDATAPDAAARMLAARADARIALMAPSVGAVAAARDYLTLFDYNIEAIARALAGDD